MNAIFKKLSYYLAVGAFLASNSPANSMLEFSSSMDTESAKERAALVHPAVLTVRYGGEPLAAEEITTTLASYIVDNRKEGIEIIRQRFTCLRFEYATPDQENRNAPVLIQVLGAFLGATVNTIIMNNNRLDTEGSTPEIGRYFPHLTSLDVSNNKVTGRLPTLLRRMQGKSILQTLELGNCDMVEEDVVYLRDSHSSLVTLDLSYNQTLRGDLLNMLGTPERSFTVEKGQDITLDNAKLRAIFIKTSPFSNLQILGLRGTSFSINSDSNIFLSMKSLPSSWRYNETGNPYRPKEDDDGSCVVYRGYLMAEHGLYWPPSLARIDIRSTPASKAPLPTAFRRNGSGPESSKKIAFIGGPKGLTDSLDAESVLLEHTLLTLCNAYTVDFGSRDKADLDGRPLLRLLLQNVVLEDSALRFRIEQGYRNFSPWDHEG